MYEFGPFRLDEKKRLLLHGNAPVALTAKAFDTLHWLVEHSERVVSKEELLEQLWPRTVVEESNLTQTIFMIRKALGESARDHRYIVTVSGVGYRFGERVSRVVEGTATPPPAIEPTSPVATPSGRRTRQLGVTLAIVIIAGLVYVLMRDRSAAPPVSSILITEFENRTGEPVFDRILRRSAIIQLSQSPAFKIVSDDSIASTLRLMRRPADVQLSAAHGREACIREGADAVLQGEVDRVGRRYVVSMQAIACQSGEHLASAAAQADEPGAILDAMGREMNKVRAKLGESLRSIKRYNRPVRAATTESLDAYQLFSAAADRWRFGPDASAAIPLFERALQIDPQFALAYSYLGSLLGNLGELDRAVAAHSKAFELRDRVSEREKLMITATYHSFVSGNVEEEIATYEQWRAQYPHDWIAPMNLAGIYSDLVGDYARTLQFAEESLRLEPRQAYAASLIATACLALGENAKARGALEDALGKGLDGASIRMGLYQVAVMEADAVLLSEQQRWSENQPVQDNIEWLLAGSASQVGQLQRMQMLISRYARSLSEAGFKEVAASEQASAALRFAMFGATEQALKHAREAEMLAATPVVWRRLAIMYAQLGMVADAERIIALIENAGVDRFFSGQDILLARALLSLSAGRPDAAVDALQTRGRYDGSAFAFDTHYVRGLALLKSGDARAAADEFRWIIERRGIGPTATAWTVAHAQLARALAASGELAKSRVAYERALELWMAADADLPLVRQIRNEAVQLTGGKLNQSRVSTPVGTSAR